MNGLTKRQKDLLEFIRSHVRENGGVPPSYDEMKEGLGLASKSGIARLMDALEERGFIRRIYHRARSLELMDEPLPGRKVGDLARSVFDAIYEERARLSASGKRIGQSDVLNAIYRGLL